MSATVVQYPVEPRVAHKHLVDDVSAAKKLQAQVRAATPVPTGERVALVLDMDECLVHSKFYNEMVECRQDEYRPADLQEYADTFEIEMDDGERALVYKRPGLDHFLEEASKHFDLYVFTAGLEAYGKPILDVLDPKGTIFAGRFFRESCQMRKGMFLKDLRVVRNDLSRVILVDNNPVSFLMQPSNGIPVPSFYDDAADRTLESLTKVLLSLREVDDVRPRLHQLFRLADLLSEHQRIILS
ncbi:hypothetical protein P43SY_003214 [Pythium insidiosum]|uniref:FCP1 homology domain-containing protein n=1 Tax=Pythium insidiosum TaxID=114742 RepID=A0AAD5LNN7_PYTIN|nr:hypothetical protein P43SY_003214 [Pythium insidiosum]KAJ0409127.1 hypothetical protein ATCC90586_002838 [Pythium insidiosum]